MNELLPCPFCGKPVDLNNADTLYPSGIFWRTDGETLHYVRHQDRKHGDSPVWGMHCDETSGGCGAEIAGNSKLGAITAWNKRA